MAAAGAGHGVRPGAELCRPRQRAGIQGAGRAAGVPQGTEHPDRSPPGVGAPGRRGVHALRSRAGGGDRQDRAQRQPRARHGVCGGLHPVQRLRHSRLPGKLLPAESAGEEPRHPDADRALHRRSRRRRRSAPAGAQHLRQRRAAPARQHRRHDFRHSVPGRLPERIHDAAAGRHDRHRHAERAGRRAAGRRSSGGDRGHRPSG